MCIEVIYDKVYTLMCENHYDYDVLLQLLCKHCKTYGIFGYPLCYTKDKTLPLPILRTIEYLRNNKGYVTEGVFRTNIDKEAVCEFKDRFNNGEDVKDFGSISAATSVLKEYLRMLPDPIIPYLQYDEFVEIGQSDENQRIEMITELINKLEPINKEILWYITSMCNLIYLCNDSSMMDMNNLGICLGMTICHCVAEESTKDAQNSQEIISAYSSIIKYYNTLFELDTESYENKIDEELRCVDSKEVTIYTYEQLTKDVKKHFVKKQTKTTSVDSSYMPHCLNKSEDGSKRKLSSGRLSKSAIMKLFKKDK